MSTGELTAGGNPGMDWHPIHGGVEILPAASRYRNRDELRPGGPLRPYADFTYLPTTQRIYLLWLPLQYTYIYKSEICFRDTVEKVR